MPLTFWVSALTTRPLTPPLCWHPSSKGLCKARLETLTLPQWPPLLSIFVLHSKVVIMDVGHERWMTFISHCALLLNAPIKGFVTWNTLPTWLELQSNSSIVKGHIHGQVHRLGMFQGTQRLYGSARACGTILRDLLMFSRRLITRRQHTSSLGASHWTCLTLVIISITKISVHFLIHRNTKVVIYQVPKSRGIYCCEAGLEMSKGFHFQLFGLSL